VGRGGGRREGGGSIHKGQKGSGGRSLTWIGPRFVRGRNGGDGGAERNTTQGKGEGGQTNPGHDLDVLPGENDPKREKSRRDSWGKFQQAEVSTARNGISDGCNEGRGGINKSQRSRGIRGKVSKTNDERFD